MKYVLVAAEGEAANELDDEPKSNVSKMPAIKYLFRWLMFICF